MRINNQCLTILQNGAYFEVDHGGQRRQNTGRKL